MFAIYQIINTINKESYIGFTSKDPVNRWRRHLYLSRRGLQKHFYRAIRKYGPECFKLEVLEEGWDPEIGKNIREPYWIFVMKPEYNHTDGGEGTLGYRHSTEERRARSSRMMGNTNGTDNRGPLGVRWRCTEEQNQAKSQRMMGHKHTPETRSAMSIAASNRKKK